MSEKLKKLKGGEMPLNQKYNHQSNSVPKKYTGIIQIPDFSDEQQEQSAVFGLQNVIVIEKKITKMSKLPQEDSFEKPVNKNIKNIYVHKINSLIKISRDSLAVEEIDILPPNKMAPSRIKKTYSQTDKTALKLQKNRESARKARQRKNLYIKLLQNQVTCLRKQLAESQVIETSSTKYLNEIKNVPKEPYIKRHSSVEEQLDRYISQDNLPNLDESKERNEKKCARLDQTIEQFKNWFIPELFKGISNLKKSQRTDINTKIFKNAISQFQQLSRNLKNKSEYSLRTLLPFEQSSPEVKITNIMKTLNKYMEELDSNLQKLSQITNHARQLIMQQELCQMEMSEMEANRIKNIVSDLSLCGIGDRADKFIERAMRWEEFPVADILKTMAKIVQFNKFIESTEINEEQIALENEKKRQRNIQG